MLQFAPRMQQFLFSLVIIFILVALLYVICIFWGYMEIFWALLSKIGFACGSRAVINMIACYGGLSFAMVWIVRALTIAAFGQMMMTPETSGSSQGSGWEGPWIDQWLNQNSVNPPIQREGPGNGAALPPHVHPNAEGQQQNHPDQPFGGGDMGARAREHARIDSAVEAITNACEKLEADMVRKAHTLLQKRGVTLADPEDVKRALQLALHADWDHDIDDRRRHFTVLRRNFGTARCERWNPFIDELRGLGNPQVNARHYVD